MQLNEETRSSNDTKLYYRYGVIPSMYYVLFENRIDEPDNYSDEEVKNITENVTENEDKLFKNANVIVLLAEAFYDIDQIDEVEFDKKITLNFNELKNEGILINMISPSYGNRTLNTEIEFLTGANLMYFTPGYIAITSLYRKSNVKNFPSIVKELKNNGYRTKIVFGYDAYMSKNAQLKIGFDEYIELTLTEENKKGDYISDEYIIDQIIEEFNNKSDDEKLFYMALTIQSHMPYYYNKYSDYDISIVDSPLSEEQNETYLSYAQGIYDIDYQLGRLYEYIQTLDEPTILVFYGDHLPNLSARDGTNVIDSFSYFNTGDEILNYYRLYNTEALILANFDVEDDETEYMSPDILGSYIINNLDIEISDYFKLIYSYKDNLASSNYYVVQDSDGNLYETGNLPENLQKIYLSREKVQYKYFIK